MEIRTKTCSLHCTHDKINILKCAFLFELVLGLNRKNKEQSYLCIGLGLNRKIKASLIVGFKFRLKEIIFLIKPNKQNVHK